MTEVYYGRSLPNAFQAIAHDIGGMRAMLRLMIGPKDKAVLDRYTCDLVYREQDLTNLADHPTPAGWQKTILRRTNDLLYEIHLLVQTPLWQYVVKEYESIDVVTVMRSDRKENT